jgi:hypothetical protein
MSTTLAFVFGLLGLLKALTIGGAVWWLRTNGHKYRAALEQCSPDGLTGSKLRGFVDACSGSRVFPWGVLEYKLHTRSRLLRLFGQNIYRFPTLPAFALAGFMCVGFTGGAVSKVAWSAVATIYQADMILLSFEAVYAYIAIGGYRRYYHVGIRLSDDSAPDTEHDMYELDVFFPLAVSAITINVLAVVVAQYSWDSFVSSQVALDVSKHWSLLLQSTYFVATTMTTIGYGDIVPHRLWGESVTILIQMQSLFLIVGLFSTMISFGLNNSKILARSRPDELEVKPLAAKKQA